MSTDHPSHPPHETARAELLRFEARNSRNGLLLRYCVARVESFWTRQAMALVAGLWLMLMVDPVIGWYVLLLCILPDAADTGLLAQAWRRFKNGTIPSTWRIAIRLSGLAQATGIVIAADFAWDSAHDVHVEFFVTAFLASAVMNTGLSRPYDRLTADLRIAAIAVALPYLIWSHTDEAHFFENHAMYLLATAMLASASYSLIRHSGMTFAKRQRIERELLHHQVALAASQEALREGEAKARRLAMVAEQANDAMLICDPDGRAEWVNETFTRVTGYTLQDIRGRRPGEVLQGPNADLEAYGRIAEARRQARPLRIDVLDRTKDGRDIWTEVSMTPIWHLDGTHAGSIQVERDITEARAATAARNRFLATMSHEIRTPMNGVIGMAELLSRTELTQEQRDYLATIIDSGEAMLNLINDILDLTKLQSGKVEIAAEPFDLSSVVCGVIALLGPMASRKGIALAADLPGQSLWLTGDAGRVRQVLLNLVGNAIKFTQTGSVNIQLVQRDGQIDIAVVDTGIGIAAERIDSIFDAFTQADGAITRAFGGTGLGLTISRMLAKAMGGAVTVASVHGEGSTFTLQLCLPPAQPVLRPEATTDEPDWPPPKPMRVLIAEDNTTNRLILSKMMSGQGVTLDEVSNGADAVEHYRRAPPDLVVMDMQMPVMDGLTAVRRIREVERAHQLPRCPIIVLTANAFREDELAATAADADAFQTKPVKRRVFLQQAATLVAPPQPRAAFPAA